MNSHWAYLSSRLQESAAVANHSRYRGCLATASHTLSKLSVGLGSRITCGLRVVESRLENSVSRCKGRLPVGRTRKVPEITMKLDFSSRFSVSILERMKIREIPKVELHRHLELSLRHSTIKELAPEFGFILNND